MGSLLLLSGLVLAYQLIVFFRDIERIRPARLGPGTWLSILRLVALSLLAGFLVLPRPVAGLSWAPFPLALFFNLSDLFDGYLARRFGGAGKLGAKLDLDLDGRGMLIGSLLVVQYGQVGWWFILAGLARYVFVYAGKLWESSTGKTLKPMPHNPLRRPFAGVEMGITTAMLAPLFSPQATNFVATLTLVPFLGNFIYDWLVVTGKTKVFKTSSRLPEIAGNIGLLVRLVTGGILICSAVSNSILGLWQANVIFGLLFAFGTALRPLAILLLVGFSIDAGNVDYVLLFLLIASLYLGPGRFALWQPEIVLIKRRLGEKRSS